MMRRRSLVRMAGVLSLACAHFGCSGGDQGGAPASTAGSGGAGAMSAAGSGGAAAGAAGFVAIGGAAGMAGRKGDEPCQPMLVKPTENPQAVKLVTQEVAAGAGATRITAVRLVGDSLVYATSDGIYRIPKAGGTPETISTMAGNMRQLFAVGETLYWLAGMQLSSVPATGTNVMPTKVFDTTLVDGSDYLFAVDATSAYTWVRATNAIQSVSLADGTATTLLEGEESQNWLLDGDSIYYAGAYNQFMRLAKTGGKPERLHQAHNILWAPGVDGTQLYYGGSDQLVRIDPPNEKALMYAPSAGFIEKIVPQGELLLWEGWQGTVGYLAKDGSRCGTVVNALFGYAGWDHDATSFYIAVEDAIYQVPF